MLFRKRKKPKGLEESEAALTEAVESLQRIEARDPEVMQTRKAWGSLGERNHFTEKLQGIMGGAR